MSAMAIYRQQSLRPSASPALARHTLDVIYDDLVGNHRHRPLYSTALLDQRHILKTKIDLSLAFRACDGPITRRRSVASWACGAFMFC